MFCAAPCIEGLCETPFIQQLFKVPRYCMKPPVKELDNSICIGALQRPIYTSFTKPLGASWNISIWGFSKSPLYYIKSLQSLICIWSSQSSLCIGALQILPCIGVCKASQTQRTLCSLHCMGFSIQELCNRPMGFAKAPLIVHIPTGTALSFRSLNITDPLVKPPVH